MAAVPLKTRVDWIKGRLGMWNNGETKFEALIGRLIEALANRDSDPLLLQHLADCVRRQDKLEAALQRQDSITAAMHKENGARLQRLQNFVIVALLSLAGMLIMQVLQSYKDHPLQAAQVERNMNQPRP